MKELLERGIRLDADGPIARLFLARPERGNAFDLAMADAFAEAAARIAKAASDGRTRVVLLAAVGRAFSVGGDLAAFAGSDAPADLVGRVAGGIHSALAQLAAIPVPVVCSVAGTAAGGGLGIALSGDIVLASAGTRFVAAYTSGGLSPDCGTSWQLARAGRAVALDLLLTNRPLGAEEAQRLGLVSRVVEAENLAAETEQVLQTLATGSRSALVATKELVRDLAPDLTGQLAREADGIVRAVAGPDGREGISAFVAKRTPVFE